ncbi:glycerate kinase [Indiicoccus explosivorum]|uniref:glycerate kinase n=1 Tax=Indiicoccus explosivorum TaxID=1917864 RepID=UPI000B44A556|nr:glycerate kinase [Indiicoccus explosivorum]
MRIVIAPNAYKGSLSAVEAAEAMEAGIRQVHPAADIVMKPMADGGEGTLDMLIASSGGERVPVSVTGPLGVPIETAYGLTGTGTAVIETARIAGLSQVPAELRNPDRTTSRGIGEVILDALDRGCRSFIIGLGGSATADGGLGMLSALGAEAFDTEGNKLEGFGRDLLAVAELKLRGLDQRLADSELKVACDVENPLCGEYGAVKVYGPQKGATPWQIERYEDAMNAYRLLAEREFGLDLHRIPGAGAAGGIGFALLALGADLLKGAELLCCAIGLEEEIRRADLVLTGEGQSDRQTFYGKGSGHVSVLARKHRVPVILISGSLAAETETFHRHFDGCFSILNRPMTAETAMAEAGKLLAQQTAQVMKVLLLQQEKASSLC